jgi:hypothetical protein
MERVPGGDTQYFHSSYRRGGNSKPITNSRVTNKHSKREMVDAIKTARNGKAAGSDNIPAEVLKVDPYATADILLPLLQGIWQREKFPKEWKEGIIIKVSKKGDLSQCRNWRGVTLLVVISKIFNKIIL